MTLNDASERQMASNAANAKITLFLVGLLTRNRTWTTVVRVPKTSH